MGPEMNKMMIRITLYDDECHLEQEEQVKLQHIEVQRCCATYEVQWCCVQAHIEVLRW